MNEMGYLSYNGGGIRRGIEYGGTPHFEEELRL